MNRSPFSLCVLTALTRVVFGATQDVKLVVPKLASQPPAADLAGQVQLELEDAADLRAAQAALADQENQGVAIPWEDVKAEIDERR